MKHILFAAALAALGAAPAFAHSPIKSTSPSDGATLAAAPDVIEIVFDGAMRLTRVTLEGPSGEAQRLGLSDIEVPTPDYRIAAPTLATGRYTVEWRGMAPDGHVMTGTFAFEID